MLVSWSMIWLFFAYTVQNAHLSSQSDDPKKLLKKQTDQLVVGTVPYQPSLAWVLIVAEQGPLESHTSKSLGTCGQPLKQLATWLSIWPNRMR